MRVVRQVTKLIRVVAVVALAPFGLLSTPAHASAIEEQLDCKSTGHVFISALMQSGEIQSKPMHVEKNSINAFRPARGVKLTAFDFPVFVVLGYEKDDPLFAGQGRSCRGLGIRCSGDRRVGRRQAAPESNRQRRYCSRSHARNDGDSL